MSLLPVYVGTRTSLFTTIIDAFMNAQDNDGEADSLFGSPPPSPASEIVRGGSPVLALPGSTGYFCASLPELPKNVGTIALPGSHNSSELVVSLPAAPPKPLPAQPTQAAQSAPRQRRSVDNRGRPKPRSKKKAKSTTSYPAASSPPLVLPDNNDALPPNFLRSQRALLGLAGIVGGVNPARLSSPGSCGSTKYNPIVVEAETPAISPSCQQNLPADDAMPNSQAIADSLVSQGNIFPVLRSLMPYYGLNTNVGCCAGHGRTRDCTPEQDCSKSTIAAPPLKRRKLNSVPAGAKDWDVPYPFPVNEGPRDYLESWQKKRGKKLMMQLVSLVREAVQKAAAKSLTREAGAEVENIAEKGPTSGSDQRREAAGEYGRDSEHPLSPEGINSPTCNTSSGEQEVMFSDFLSSSGISMDRASSGFDSLLGAVNDALSDPNVQLSGGDLAAMSSYPFSPTYSVSPTSSSSTRLSTPCDLNQLSSAGSKENDFQLPDFDLDEIPIDPSLLDLSWPNLAASETQNVGDAPAPFENVIDSSRDQTTVHLSSPDGSSGGSAFDLDESALGLASDNADPQALPSAEITAEFPTQERENPALCDALESRAEPQPLEMRCGSSMVDTDRVRGRRGFKSALKKLDRQRLLHRARIRREQLASELARAKIELWETTIEQGVLTHLSKDKELQPKA